MPTFIFFPTFILNLNSTVDRRYKDVPDGELPKGESLEMCAERVMVYWEEELCRRSGEGIDS